MARTRDLNDVTAFLVAGEAGEYLFRQGETGAELFLLQQGQVELVDESSGTPRQLVVLQAGDVFGERQVFAPGVRPVSARAVTDFQAFRIDRPTLAQIVTEDASVALGFIERLAARPAALEGLETSSLVPRSLDAAPGPGAAARPRRPRRAAAARGPHRLTLADGRAAFDLTGQDTFVVGRQDRATGYKPDIDLTPYDDARSLSRRHARIVVRDGRVFVREEKATRNGTLVDGQRLEAGTEVELVDGASVRFGLVDAVFGRGED